MHDDPFSLDPGSELLTAKPLRHGVLLFVVHNLGEDQRELGLRATRLFAANTRPDPQWEHADYRPQQDLLAAQPLFDWIAGAPGAGPAASSASAP